MQNLEAKELITIFSVIAIITGWFVNGYLNRKNDISKKRLEYRMPALQSFFEVWFFITKNGDPFTDSKFLPLVEKARMQIGIFGKVDEIELYEKFIESFKKQNLTGANDALNKLVPLFRLRIRKELDIE